MGQIPANTPWTDCTSQTRTIDGLLDQAAEHAVTLAPRASQDDDAQLAAAATTALRPASDLHGLGELLATIAGVPEPVE